MLKGSHHTELTKTKIRLSKVGQPGYWKEKYRSEKTIKKISSALMGNIPWNKGKKGVCSKETLEKMRLAHMGKPSCWKGKHLTEEHKNKLSEAHLGEKNFNYGKQPTEETRNKISNSLIDWDFYNEHGCLKSNYPYNDCFTRKFKDKIRVLYDNKCVVTGMTNEEHKAKYGMSLHVHHWMYNKDETNPFCFIPVTSEINGMANFNKSEWQEMFNGIAEDKYCEML